VPQYPISTPLLAYVSAVPESKHESLEPLEGIGFVLDQNNAWLKERVASLGASAGKSLMLAGRPN